MSDKSPDAFRTISEVADWLGVQPHVLRFWESKFSQVRPVKRAGGRRYYRPNDMLLLGGIRKLLHEDGLTIKGAQKVLREEGMSHVARLSRPLDAESAALSGMHAGFEEDATLGETPSPTVEQHQPEAPAPVVERSPDPAPAPSPPRESSQPDHSAAPREQVGKEPAPDRPPPPAFVRSSATRKLPEPEPQGQDPTHEKQAQPDRLPSFLQAPTEAEAPAAPPQEPAASPVREDELPLSFPAAPDEPEIVPEAVAGPRPNLVDAPDPDESRFEVAPAALSAAFSTTSISPRRRAEILPLVARLAALRDRMAAAQDR